MALIRAFLLIVEAMGEIEGDQAEVSRRSTFIVEDDKVLMASGAGFQLQIIRVAMRTRVVMIGMFAIEALHGDSGGPDRPTVRTFDHVAVFAQSLAIESQHLVPIVGSAEVGHSHSQLE